MVTHGGPAIRFLSIALFGFMAIGVPTRAGATTASTSVRWTCSVPILSSYQPKTQGPDVGEAVSYLFVGYKAPLSSKVFRADYGADALFVAPLDRKNGWYDSGVRLGPMNENNGFVQIEISRWERFGFKPHVGVAWALPRANSVDYRDLGLMLADGVAYRLGIYVDGGLIHLLVDNRSLCSTAASQFVSFSEPKYFQVRTETSVVGSNGRASVSDLRLKRDSDALPRPFQTDCILHRYGVFWQYIRNGRFVAQGAFDPRKTTFFKGIDPTKPCHT